jgi:pyruvate dehydrogenase E1 component
LQHQDGTSHLLASTIPTCKAYDPCFKHELAVILQDGMRRMLEAQEDVFYYVTVTNENYVHPAMPADAEEGIRRGMYRLRESRRENRGPVSRVQLLGSGAILREVLAAADALEKEHGVAADVWSVTSWTELRWDGLLAGGHASAAMREARAHAGGESWVAQCLSRTEGPLIAVADYVSAVADLVRPFIPAGRRYVALGTDGFGRSDTRRNLRAFFAVDRAAVVAAALRALGRA